MDLVANWEGWTQTHGFNVCVFRDSIGSRFVAQLQVYSPPLMQQVVPGATTPQMIFDHTEEIEHENIDQLREMTKLSIASRFGIILQFLEK